MGFEERKKELIDWADREFNIVFEQLKKDNASESEKDIYRCALTVYKNLIDNLEDESTLIPAEAVLISLMRGEPLTPIEDSDEDWVWVEGFDQAIGNDNPGYSIYQNRRRNTLFKKVIMDGDKGCTKFSDVGRCVCVDIKNGQTYDGGFGYTIFDTMHPVIMPYSPSGKVRIFTEDFKYHEEYEGDYDTFGVIYFRYPNGEMEEVMRFFKMDPKINQLVAIDKTEYLSRKKRYKEREAKKGV